MDQGTRTRATWLTAGALAVVVVVGSVIGTREVTRSLEPGVTAAVEAATGDDSGRSEVAVQVRGREVRIDPRGADDAVVRRAVEAAQGVDGVRSVEVRPVEVGGRTASASGDVDLTLEVTPMGIAFASAVPTKALADEIGRRVAQVRGVPVAVDLAVDPTLPSPRWWPALEQVLDTTAQVHDLRLVVREGALRVEGSTVSDAADTRVGEELGDVDGFDDVSVSLERRTVRGLDERAAAVLEGTSIGFGIGSAVLGPRGRDSLDDLAAVLRRSDVSLDVLGHAGPANRTRGDELASARAEAVRAHLVARGVPPSRLVVTAIGSGADRGIDPWSAQYRRVDFRVEDER